MSSPDSSHCPVTSPISKDKLPSLYSSLPGPHDYPPRQLSPLLLHIGDTGLLGASSHRLPPQGLCTFCSFCFRCFPFSVAHNFTSFRSLLRVISNDPAFTTLFKWQHSPHPTLTHPSQDCPSSSPALFSLIAFNHCPSCCIFFCSFLTPPAERGPYMARTATSSVPLCSPRA